MRSENDGGDNTPPSAKPPAWVGQFVKTFLRPFLTSWNTPFLCHSFTVNKYLSPRAGLCVLHSQGKCEVPDWMGVVRELRGEEDERMYGAYGISLKEGEERGRMGSVGRGSGGRH